jgi:hypothetical protein
MRKLDMTPYPVTVTGADGKEEQVPYAIRQSLRLMLLHPQLNLGAEELLVNGDLSDKLRDAPDVVLLEEDEYTRLLNALSKIKGFRANDIELIRRVKNAEKIDVQEAPAKV